MQGIVFVYDLKRSIINRQFTIRLEERNLSLNRWIQKPYRKIFSAKDLKNPEIESLIVDPSLFRKAFRDEVAFRKIEGRFFFVEDEFTSLRISSADLADFIKGCHIKNTLCDKLGNPIQFNIKRRVKPHIKITLSDGGYEVSVFVSGFDLTKADYFIRANHIICVYDTTIAYLPDIFTREFFDHLLSPKRFSYEAFKAVREMLNAHAEYLVIHFPTDKKKKTIREAPFKAELNLTSSLNRGDLTFIYHKRFAVQFNDEKRIFFDFKKNTEIHRNMKDEKKMIEAMEKSGVIFHPPGKGKVFLSSENMLELFKSIEKIGVHLMMDGKPLRIETGVNWQLSIHNKHLLVSGDIRVGRKKADLSDLFDAYLSGERFFNLADGSVSLISDDIGKLLRSLEIRGDFKDESIVFQREEFFVVSEIFKQYSEFGTNQAFNRCLELKDQTDSDIALPKGFEIELRSYQKLGFRWLMRLYTLGFCGILADDMGLGKTLQTLVFLLGIKEKKKRGTALLIVPKTLIWNWENEIKRFTPSIRYHLYIGEKKERSLKGLNDIDLVITNYHLALNDFNVLKARKWRALILDEAQTIKNPDAKMTRTIKKLRAGFKLALTGTPMENRPLDLWSQFDFLMPGFLGGVKKFKKRYEKGGNDSFKELKHLTAPFILRREKKEVLFELPEKTEIVRYCEFREGQRNLYDEIRLFDQLRMEEMEPDTSQQTIHLLTMVLRLRQIACHPLLFPEPKRIVPESGKLEAVLQTADEILSENHKILIFSQFVKHLELVKKECDQLGIENFFLHGSTKDRSGMINRFKESQKPAIFFISLKAGGFGINLTEASYVFLLDPWWNPAVENQAIDRCYRMGQRKNVTVIRFITKDSIEERVKRLQKKKKEMIDQVITGSDLTQSPLTHDELVSLIRH